MLRYREFLSLTDEEIMLILTDIFNPIKIENIQREEGFDVITAEITMDGWSDGETVYESTDEITLKPNTIQVDFSVDSEDMLKYKQFLLAKGCSYLLKDNPYLE